MGKGHMETIQYTRGSGDAVNPILVKDPGQGHDGCPEGETKSSNTFLFKKIFFNV